MIGRLKRDAFGWNRHREDPRSWPGGTRRSRAADTALHPWIASLTLAMTSLVRPNRIMPWPLFLVLSGTICASAPVASPRCSARCRLGDWRFLSSLPSWRSTSPPTRSPAGLLRLKTAPTAPRGSWRFSPAELRWFFPGSSASRLPTSPARCSGARTLS